MSLTARICGLVIILIGGKSVLWAQEKSSDLSIAGLSTPKSSPPSVLGARAAAISPQLPQLQAAEGRVVTLDELVTEALDRNPEILAAGRKFDAATKRPSQVSTLPEPKFSFTNFGVGHPASALNGSDFAYLGIGVSQEFPLAGKAVSDEAMARKEADSERQMVLDAELRVISRLKQAYYDLSYSHKAIEIVEKNRDLLDKFTKIAEAKYRVGSGIQQDVLKAQVEISTLMQRLEMLGQQRGSLEAFINSLLNRPVSVELGKPAPSE